MKMAVIEKIGELFDWDKAEILAFKDNRDGTITLTYSLCGLEMTETFNADDLQCKNKFNNSIVCRFCNNAGECITQEGI